MLNINCFDLLCGQNSEFLNLAGFIMLPSIYTAKHNVTCWLIATLSPELAEILSVLIRMHTCVCHSWKINKLTTASGPEILTLFIIVEGNINYLIFEIFFIF